MSSEYLSALYADSPNTQNRNLLHQILTLRGQGLNLPHHIHPINNPAERREALTIGVAPAAEVQLRLIPNADKKLRVCRAGFISRHRNDSVFVADSCLHRGFVRDGRQFLRMLVILQAALNHLDLELVTRLIIHPHHAIKPRARKTILVHIPQEVRNGHRRPQRMQLDDDIANLRSNTHTRILHENARHCEEG